ncbi:hypothetical protein Anapl_06568 [Anas platyrhynchos]|uniref:Uncharacterized protein n=1 Tax=Anas platyrhynchos TaxID=8839 RepID=R0LF97_ANAPL|nr:hypothetical protein Anapl_06568 [Anas platyrhynchos]
MKSFLSLQSATKPRGGEIPSGERLRAVCSPGCASDEAQGEGAAPHTPRTAQKGRKPLESPKGDPFPGGLVWDTACYIHGLGEQVDGVLPEQQRAVRPHASSCHRRVAPGALPALMLIQARMLSTMLLVFVDKNVTGCTDLVCSLAVGEIAASGSVVVCVQAQEVVLARCSSSLPARDQEALQ